MELATFSYARGEWSRSFPALDSERTLVLAFAAPGYYEQPELLQQLAHAYPRSAVIGCSTSGEIDQTQIRDASISVAAVRFDATVVRYAAAEIDDKTGSFDAGVRVAIQLRRADLKAVLVLSEGIHVNGSDLVRGLNSALSPDVVVTGGLAGDGDRFARTWVLANGQARTNGVVAVGLYGSHVRIGHGSKGGWDTFGPERAITSSDRNVLYTLDDRPALALYKEYLGGRASGLPGTALLFPLAVRARHEEHSVVRTVLSVDEQAQSLTFAGDVPTGHYAKLMRANFDRLILGAHGAGELAMREHVGPTLSLAISCVGRRLVLGERSEEETEATLDALPDGTKQVGFYSYGEISPHTSGRCDLHNQTMTLTVLSEV